MSDLRRGGLYVWTSLFVEWLTSSRKDEHYPVKAQHVSTLWSVALPNNLAPAMVVEAETVRRTKKSCDC